MVRSVQWQVDHLHEVPVLVGLLATQTITVVVVHALVRSARLLPADLQEALIP